MIELILYICGLFSTGLLRNGIKNVGENELLEHLLNLVIDKTNFFLKKNSSPLSVKCVFSKFTLSFFYYKLTLWNETEIHAI